MARPKPELVLTADERQKLAAWARRPTSAQRLALRARIVPACADEPSNKAVAATLGVRDATVGTRRRRFPAKRLDGLTDDPRPGTPRAVTGKHIADVVTKAAETKPKAATHGSTRAMARAAGMSRSAIARVRRAFGLKPRPAETFKLSTDPYLVDKVRSGGGPDLAPPAKAIVLSVDEKSQVQALDRTQPILPMTPGQAERGTHDHVRHGTTPLFAALNVAIGHVIGQCRGRHRHREFVTFLDHLDATPAKEPGVSTHIVLDNSATRKTPAVKRWLLRHPEYRLRFTPTSSSWPNQIGRFLAATTEERIGRGAFRSVPALVAAINEDIAEHNTDPKPFNWVADADAILDRIKKVCERTSDPGHW